MQSTKIEEIENQYAREIASAHYGSIEASIYGYQDRVIQKLHNLEEEILCGEKRLLSTIRTLQFLTFSLLGTSVVGTALLIFNIQENQSLPAVKISMAIFLPLVAFEGITNWYPNLFISGKLLRAQREVDSLTQDVLTEVATPNQSPVGNELQIQSASVAWDKPFMSAVSATVSAGELLVIRGKSGSGKSTLALAITGLLSYEGSITIGGVEIRDIKDSHLYISASLQRGHIFNTSLRENLKIANPDLIDSQMLQMLNLLELDAISLDEVIGEFGRPLSGGEAKRVGVARALLSLAPVVLLDEPTEHLDRELAERLEVRITDVCRDKSLIVITHTGWAKSTRTVVIERE
jgi:ATP-binding cassette subfamily C protein CydC